MKRFTSWGLAQAGSTLVVVLVVLAVVAVLGLGVWRIATRNKHNASPSTNTQQQAANHGASQTSQPLTSGTDDQSLAKDINNLNGSINEGTQNLQAANTATDDQSHVIDVPTN